MIRLKSLLPETAEEGDGEENTGPPNIPDFNPKKPQWQQPDGNQELEKWMSEYKTSLRRQGISVVL